MFQRTHTYRIIILSVLIGLVCSCGEQNHFYNYDQTNPEHAGTFPEIEAPNYNFKRTYGIVITVYNRADFLKKTLDSLAKTDPDDLKKAHIIIVDDASTNPEISKLISKFDLPDTLIQKLSHDQNSGVLTGLFHGFKLLAKNVDYIINIDADVIMNKNWLSKLKFTFEKINDDNIILTGFNTSNHPTKTSYADYVEKESIGGINFFMNAKFYNNQFQGWFNNIKRLEKSTWKEWDWSVVNKMAENQFKFYATKPSLIQHIGITGLNSKESKHDLAEDFVPDIGT